MTDWTPESVKAAVYRTGVSLTELLERAGYTRGAAIVLRRPWPAVEEAIAAHLHLSPQEIWPSRYHENGVSVIRPYRTRQERSPNTHNSTKIHRQRAGTR